ncbi:hypothetical protein ACFXTH_034132 [Malus domestica]
MAQVFKTYPQLLVIGLVRVVVEIFLVVKVVKVIKVFARVFRVVVEDINVVIRVKVWFWFEVLEELSSVSPKDWKISF